MSFVPKKKSDKKAETRYKSLYISQKLVDEIEKIATDNNTSFNHVIISMIEHCLEQ